ncbi:alpha/beta hydrolase family protein [Gordonia asplenii]|uniref:alpha/beta hydrolase family protein n=1 Tax=Gordonia asplenii TaxID=2725283 RepID=UPI001FE24D4F|nr:CocE/NonD family hydrolase [Gordonia asplenii]
MFATAAELLPHTAHPVRADVAEIPYRDEQGETTIHGWLFAPAAAPDGPRPTIVSPAGYDSTAESGWVYSMGAVARGYTVLSVEGPGQGKSLYVDRRYFRPDYEVAATQILDWALSRDDVDDNAVVMVGRSFAGYLAPRAVAHDDRWAGLVCDPAQPDMGAKLPSGAAGTVAAPLMTALAKASREKADFFGARMAAHGTTSIAEYFAELPKYSMLDSAAAIRCPTLIVECPGDPVGGGGRALLEVMAPGIAEYREFDAGSGIDGHIGGLGQRPWEEAVFDWVDATIAGAG